MGQLSVEDAIHKLLWSNVGISNIVGVDKIRPFRPASGDGDPWLVYQRVSTLPTHHLLGHSGWSECLIQISGVAKSYVTLQALREAVRLCLDTKPENTVTIGANSITLHGISLADDRDIAEAAQAGTDQSYFGFAQAYRVWFSEPDPYP
jgi:hypothetical protein